MIRQEVNTEQMSLDLVVLWVQYEIAKSIRSLVEKIVADRKGKLFDTHKTERGCCCSVASYGWRYISMKYFAEQDGMMGVVTSTKNKWYGDVTTTFNEIPSLKV